MKYDTLTRGIGKTCILDYEFAQQFDSWRIVRRVRARPSSFKRLVFWCNSIVLNVYRLHDQWEFGFAKVLVCLIYIFKKVKLTLWYPVAKTRNLTMIVFYNWMHFAQNHRVERPNHGDFVVKHVQYVQNRELMIPRYLSGWLSHRRSLGAKLVDRKVWLFC